jgi:hypothetical protein
MKFYNPDKHHTVTAQYNNSNHPTTLTKIQNSKFNHRQSAYDSNCKNNLSTVNRIIAPPVDIYGEYDPPPNACMRDINNSPYMTPCSNGRSPALNNKYSPPPVYAGQRGGPVVEQVNGPTAYFEDRARRSNEMLMDDRYNSNSPVMRVQQPPAVRKPAPLNPCNGQYDEQGQPRRRFSKRDDYNLSTKPVSYINGNYFFSLNRFNRVVSFKESLDKAH